MFCCGVCDYFSYAGTHHVKVVKIYLTNLNLKQFVRELTS
jgi:hypothetical protein